MGGQWQWGRAWVLWAAAGSPGEGTGDFAMGRVGQGGETYRGFPGMMGGKGGGVSGWGMEDVGRGEALTRESNYHGLHT